MSHPLPLTLCDVTADKYLLAPNDTWKKFHLIDCLPYADYVLFVDVCKDSVLTKYEKACKTKKLLIDETIASETQCDESPEQQEQQAGGSDDVASDDRDDDGHDDDDHNIDYDDDSDSVDDGDDDDDDIGVQRHRYNRNCYWSRTYCIRPNFWNRDDNGKITFNYLGFLQR